MHQESSENPHERLHRLDIDSFDRELLLDEAFGVGRDFVELLDEGEQSDDLMIASGCAIARAAVEQRHPRERQAVFMAVAIEHPPLLGRCLYILRCRGVRSVENIVEEYQRSQRKQYGVWKQNIDVGLKHYADLVERHLPGEDDDSDEGGDGGGDREPREPQPPEGSAAVELEPPEVPDPVEAVSKSDEEDDIGVLTRSNEALLV